MTTAMLDAALDLARAGWEIFPCIPRGAFAKAPYKDPALGLEHGHLHATSDPKTIKRWWRRWPNAMIGARVPRTMLVIDIDPRKGGDLAELIKLVGQLPPTLSVWSGRNDGGHHLYFRVPVDLETTSTRLPKGIDLKKGGKGYCIVPPSIHPVTGQPYRWELHEPAILPYRLRELLTPPPKPIYRAGAAGNANGAGLIRTVAETKEGGRHDVLVWAAGRAVKDGILDQVEEELVAASVSTGYPERDARRTIDSMRRPRS